MFTRWYSALAALAFLAIFLAIPSGTANAGVYIGVGVPGPYYRPYYHHHYYYGYGPYYYRPGIVVAAPPVYVAPRPVYVVPPAAPVYVQPAPTVITTPGAPPATLSTVPPPG